MDSLAGKVLRGGRSCMGQLEADSSEPLTLTLPYRPTVTDYAVEFRLQSCAPIATEWGLLHDLCEQGTRTRRIPGGSK